MNKTILGVLILIISLFLLISAAYVDSKIKKYRKMNGYISGKLTSVGSDTLLNLMTYWTEGFGKVYPGVKSEVEGKGSSTAPPALIEGASLVGPMSRAMKDIEEDKFVAKFGYKPAKFIVAIDALAIYVNKDNPIESLTLAEADAIFSKTGNQGHDDVVRWGQVGLSGSWTQKPISIYGRNSASGTYGYFKSVVLKKGDYKDTVKEQPGSASVVQGIEKDIYAIGYSGIGYITSGVKTVKLGKSANDTYGPTVDNALNGKYPLARPLYLYINKKPGEKLPELVEEFIKYVLSKEGQEIVIKDGFIPLPKNILDKELAKLN
jgi:phosphate transport system substrate-binding protein